MRIPILLHATADEPLRSSGRPPLTVDGLGATRREALGRLREAIERRAAEGSVLVPTEIATTAGNPRTAGTGFSRDDPIFDG